MIEGVRERETDLPVSPMSDGEREVGLSNQNAIGSRRGEIIKFSWWTSGVVHHSTKRPTYLKLLS